MDLLAEPVIGRRFAPTRWLAMTIASRLSSATKAGDPVRRGLSAQLPTPVTAHAVADVVITLDRAYSQRRKD
jgi:hypothetical protein